MFQTLLPIECVGDAFCAPDQLLIELSVCLSAVHVTLLDFM
jgi:hypothetical protein